MISSSRNKFEFGVCEVYAHELESSVKTSNCFTIYNSQRIFLFDIIMSIEHCLRYFDDEPQKHTHTHTSERKQNNSPRKVSHTPRISYFIFLFLSAHTHMHGIVLCLVVNFVILPVILNLLMRKVFGVQLTFSHIDMFLF